MPRFLRGPFRSTSDSAATADPRARVESAALSPVDDDGTRAPRGGLRLRRRTSCAPPARCSRCWPCRSRAFDAPSRPRRDASSPRPSSRRSKRSATASCRPTTSPAPRRSARRATSSRCSPPSTACGSRASSRAARSAAGTLPGHRSRHAVEPPAAERFKRFVPPTRLQELRWRARAVRLGRRPRGARCNDAALGAAAGPARRLPRRAREASTRWRRRRDGDPFRGAPARRAGRGARACSTRRVPPRPAPRQRDLRRPAHPAHARGLLRRARVRRQRGSARAGR